MAIVARRGRAAPNRRQLKQWLAGYLFVMPVILGILLFTMYPMFMSLYYSFTRFDILSPPRWIGWGNYDRLLHDSTFWTSIVVTFHYALVAVPLGLLLSGLLSILLNQPLKGISIYRALFYIPVVVPAIAAAILFGDLFNVDYGVANWVLRSIGLPEYTWFSRPQSALNSLILMSLWGIGGSTIIWIAGLRAIPRYLYEAATVDGAGRFRQFLHVTIPMLSPVIFFNLIIGIIQSIQTFTQVYVLTSGGPEDSTLFVVLNIYQQGFVNFRMGYASAIAWVLLLIIVVFTIIIFRTNGWVYYEGGDKR